MRRYCFVRRIHPDKLAGYRERHRDVWPEMLDALRRAGWTNYSLFLGEDGMLIGYVEAEDLEAAQRAMEATEVNGRWQAEMAEYFVLPPGARPDTALVHLEEIFHLD